MNNLMLLIFSILFYSTIEAYDQSKFKSNELHIGGTFPMSGDWAGGTACRPAIQLALEDINKRTDVLHDYKLVLHDRDSRCLPGVGTKMMYELLYNPPKKITFLAGCSTVTTFVAQAAKMWNLVVLAYGSSSPALSNRARFPTFFRTHPSANIQNPTRFKLITKWKWTKVALLWQMEEVFSSTIADFENKAANLNITITNRQSFQKDPTIAVKSLKKADARIIVGLFYEKLARRVFCEAYHQGLYGKKHVWLIIGWYADDWWAQDLEVEGINCIAEQMREAINGHFTTESLMWNKPGVKTDSGITSEEFATRLHEKLRREKINVQETVKVVSSNSSDSSHSKRESAFLGVGARIPGYAESPLAYDALWALAFALDKADHRLRRRNKTLLDFDYDNKAVFDEIYAAMNETNFVGVSVSLLAAKHN